jgi:hypothetical protein
VTLNAVSSTGVSRAQVLRDQIKQLKKAKRSARALEEELRPVKLESNTGWLLRTFNELSDTREYTEVGPLAITYTEVKAYVELMGVPLTPWEVGTIKAMDAAFLAETYRMRSKSGHS